MRLHKLFAIVAGALMLSQPVFGQQTESTDTTTLAAATVLGEMMRQQVDAFIERGVNINKEEFCKIFTQSFMQQPTGMTPDQADRYMSDLFRGLQAQQQQASALDKEQQQAFVNSAASQPGAIVTPSGLVFQVITEGEGAMPKAGDEVALTYTGRLADGKVFDSTETTVTFPVDGLIPGFTEGLKMMKPGGTYRIVIPSDLGYGDYGIDGVIPGNAALDFVINLESVVPSDSAK